MGRSKELQFIEEQRRSQIVALTQSFQHVPLPKGRTAQGMRKALEIVWQSGFDTGVHEIRGDIDDINQQQRMQVLTAMESLGLEREVDAEILVHVWRCGVLTARDLHNIHTSEHPARRKMTNVKVSDDG
ncbi:MAG: hypothetical protein C5B59_13640 [Bacteroidetes bacterium]|nr:MAG: hypothetical protein C5B59_13640 [Bacteroidota bacterium]